MNRRTLTAVAPLIGLLLGLSLACGGLGAGGSGIGSGSYSDRGYPDAAPGAEGYAALDQAYRVPPDRASVAVTIQVEQPTPAETTRLLTSEVAAVVQVVGSGCSASPLDYTSPAPRGADTWTATAEVRLDIDLRTLTTVDTRRDRIDGCLAGIAPLLTVEGWKKVGPSGTRHVQRSEPVLMVDAPDQHRDALLAKERARLAWAATAAGAPQLHPTDLRCVPDGNVLVGDRRLSGVVLMLEMPCRVEPPEEAGEAEAGSDG